MNSNKYVPADKASLAYAMEDLSYLFGKDDWDNDNRGYTDTVRYNVNMEVGAGTRRQFSINFAQLGFNSNFAAKLPMLDFVIEYHTQFPYSRKFHGANMVLSGEFNIAQLNAILENVGTADNGKQFSMVHATTNRDGIAVTVKVVNLRTGKKVESIYLTDAGELEVAEIRLKSFSRSRKAYKRNRRALS